MLVASEIGSAIFQPLRGFLPISSNPLFTYPTDAEIIAVLISLFFLGGVLIVSGREAFSARHSEQTVLSFALWIAVTVFDLFLLPTWFAALGTITRPYTLFAVTGMVETLVAVTGIALLTYDLQSLKGKILLWLGILIGVGLAVAFDSQNLHVFPYYSNIVQQTILASPGLSPALFAGAFLAAWSRLRKRDY